MNDFIKRSKYDLRETRFSQNCQTSIEINNQSCFDYHNPMQRNTITSESPFKIKNNFSSIHHDQSFAYMTEQTKANNDKEMLRSIFGKKIQKNQSPVTFKKSFSYFDDNIITRTSLQSLDHSVKYESALKYLSDALQQKESPDHFDDESEQQEDVFSQKLSIIRGLEEKLSNIQQKIKVSSTSPVNQKLNVSTSPINIRNNTLSKLSNQNNIKQIQTDRKTDIKITEYQNYEVTKIQPQLKFNEKSSINQSLESQSMLLDKDISTSEKQLSTLKNPQKILQREIQIVQVVKFIQIPLLIEVASQGDEKIESKKSFYFQENQEIHKTFQEFTQKECLIEKSSRKESLSQDMLNIETKIKPSTMQQNFQLQYSGTGIIQNPSQAIEQLSMLSMNESNKTFHNDLKEKQHDMSYNFDENSQILSKLLTKHNNPSQLEEFDQKLKSVQVEVEQLKQSLNEKQLENSQLQEENKLLTSELQSLIEFEFIYLQKLKQYEETLQQSKQQFNQFHQMQSQKIKQHYEKIIEQYENEQSQYANRIIKFEEMFLEQQNKEEKYVKIIEQQQQQIQQLNRLAVEKEREIENQVMKIQETQNIVIERETQLKEIIENLERDNLQLKNHIRSIHARYQAEGFYILKEQAQEIKKTIEEKDESHIEELQKLENRYTNIIAKYQAQLEAMKKGLEKVRIDKSVQMSKTIKSKSSQRQKDSDQKNNIFRKRPNVFKTQFSNVDTQLKKSSINQQKINGLDQLKKEQVESTEYSEDTQKINSLLVSQITYLKEQNSQLKTDLYNQRKDKHCLSQKLHQITNLMARQISQLNESQSQLEKNQQVLQKCVQQLQKQYEINKLLRQELQKTKEIMKNQIKTQKFSSEIIDEEQIKLHPIYLELNKKYIKSKKHIKILEKQLLQLTLLPEFSEQTNKCCQNKDMMIQELKEIAFKEIM